MQFKKYSKITNSYDKKYLGILKEQQVDDGHWYVSEKCHGSNMAFYIDREYNVKVASRTQFVDGQFFNCQSVIDKYHDTLVEMSKKVFTVHNEDPKVETVIVYGELMGSNIQKGIFYSKEKDFYAFDLAFAYTQDDETKMEYQTFYAMEEWFNTFNIPYSHALKVGTLDECLEYPNDFQSTIHAQYNQDTPDGDNVCEGVVLKPCIPKHTRNGSRVIIKNKNEKWKEKTKKIQKAPVELPNEVKVVLEPLSQYVTVNRLKNVLSKLGEITEKDFGSLLKSFKEDVLEDYIEEHGEVTLEKEHKKQFGKTFNKLCAELIKENFRDILNEDF